MLSWTIQNYLERNQIPFEKIEHPLAFTAAETAHAAHLSGKRLAKTVIVRADGQMTMVVLHANEMINIERLRESLGVQQIELVSEREFEERFPDCEPGAMPPFGDLFRMPVIVSESVAADEYLTFNAGTHTDLISIPYNNFRELVQPVVGTFSSH